MGAGSGSGTGVGVTEGLGLGDGVGVGVGTGVGVCAGAALRDRLRDSCPFVAKERENNPITQPATIARIGFLNLSFISYLFRFLILV